MYQPIIIGQRSPFPLDVEASEQEVFEIPFHGINRLGILCPQVAQASDNPIRPQSLVKQSNVVSKPINSWL